jgi:hypothetical protein
MQKLQFIVQGPITIPCQRSGKNTKIKHIGDAEIKNFWENETAKELAAKNGCYIFAIKAGRGYTPWYIGQASKSLKSECFQDHKRSKYSAVAFDEKIPGTPVMFFIIPPGNKKKVPKEILNDLEKTLIQAAKIKNPELLNIKKTKNGPKWGIKGVLRSTPGQPSEQSSILKKMMGF